MGWYYGKLSKKNLQSFHPKTTGLEITFPASGLAGLLGGTDVMRILSISLHIFHSGFQRGSSWGCSYRGFPNPQLTSVWKNDALKLKVTYEVTPRVTSGPVVYLAMRSVLSLHCP